MKTTAGYAKVVVSADGSGVIGQAGALLLTETLRVSGLGQALSIGLGRWRRPRALHDPGKVIADLAVMLALGGDCLAGIAVLRAEPELFGRVASDPTVSRLVTTLAAGSNTAADHITTARAALAQIPAHLHKQVLIRTDSGGGTHEFLNWVTARRLKYSIGFNQTDDIRAAILALPKRVGERAVDTDGEPRDGA